MAKYEAFCRRCGAVLNTTREWPKGQDFTLLIQAQAFMCSTCDRGPQISTTPIGVRPVD